ncbi:MAG: right-handed parallel beta-helix repeat-containing protein [Oligoflexia bacterium]|nr:right-handed parallel beta-helix repeat-containing protein [Oligoflexia bacterium]
MKKKILLSLLLLSCSTLVRAGGDEDATTYIKSRSGVQEVPLSWLQNKERGAGSLILEKYSDPATIPHSPEKAKYFPITDKSLDVILSFLSRGEIAGNELCDSKQLCADVDACKLSTMAPLLRADIQEKELLENFPKLRPLSQLYPEVYQRILLAVAAKKNDANFLQYVMSKHNTQEQYKMLHAKSDLQDYLNKDKKNLDYPLSASDFSKFASGARASIADMVLAAEGDAAKTGIRPMLLQQGLITPPFNDHERMSLERLKQIAFERCQHPFERPEIVPIPILDPPNSAGVPGVGMDYKAELAVTASNVLDRDGFYMYPRPRAAVNSLPMDIFVDTDKSGMYQRKTWEDVNPNFSSPDIQPPIDKSKIPPEGRVLTELIVGHQAPNGKGWPQLFDIRSSAYVRFAGYPPQVTGASMRLGAHGIFSKGGPATPNVREDFPIVRAVFGKIKDRKVSNVLMLVESDLFCGAFDVDMTEGKDAEMIVDSNWYTRNDFKWKEDPHTALVAYSSMVYKTKEDTVDRPSGQAHDSDTLIVNYANGDEERVVLAPPKKKGEELRQHQFKAKARSKGGVNEWILANEDRNPEHYADFKHALGDTNYDKRASYKVKILDTNIKTGVGLYEDSPDGEYGDNIVAASTVHQDIMKAKSPQDFIHFKYKTTAFYPNPALNQKDECGLIRDGIAKLPASGGEVIVPAGTYNCTSSIVIDRDNVTIKGAGEDKVTIRLADYVHQPLMIIGDRTTIQDEAGNYVTGKPVKNVTVSGITLDGNKANHDVTKECGEGSCDGDAGAIRNNGITIRGASNVLIENVTTHDMISGGLVTEKYCDHLTVRNFNSYGNYFDGFAGYETKESLFENLDLHHNNGAGISIDINFNNNVIKDSHLHHNKDVGIFARQLHGNKFVKVDILNNGNHGVFMAKSEGEDSYAYDNTFDAVKINGSNGYGIWISDNCQGNKVIGSSDLSGNTKGATGSSIQGILGIDNGVILTRNN